MTSRPRKKTVFNIIAAVIIIAAAFASYHRLFLKTPSGQLEYTAVRWGLKTFMYPRLIFNSDSIRSGIWPLWNPYSFGGAPWVSNFQAMLFHPVNLLLILLFGYSAEVLQLQLALIFSIAGLAIYLCAREFGVHRSAALLSAISFLACGFFVGNASYFPQINTLAVFPLVFLFVRRTVRRGGWGSIAGGAFSTAVMIFSGFPTLAFFLAAFSAVFGILDIWQLQRAFAAAGWRKTLRLAILFAAALALSAPLLFPALESYPLIARPDYSPGSPLSLPSAVVRAKSLAPGNLLSLVFPFLARRRLADYNLWIEFRNCSIGLVGLFFAAFYFLFRRGRERWVLLSLFSLSLFFSLGMNTSLYALLYRRILPFGMVSHPALDFRAIFLFLLCLAAGLGMDNFLTTRPRPARSFQIAALCLILAGGVLLAAESRVRGLSLGGVFRGNRVWFISVAALLGLVSWRKLPGKYLSVCLVVLALADTAWWVNSNFATVAAPVSGSHWIRRRAKEAARPRGVTAAENFQRKRQYPGRRGVKSMFWKYFSDSGNDGTRLRDFQELMRSPARELLTEDFRVKPFYSVLVLADAAAVKRRLRAGVDFDRTALVSRAETGDGELLRKLSELAEPRSGRGVFRGGITYFSPNLIRYDLELPAPALVVFNEIYYPGWRLREAGRRLPLFRVDLALRGAYLPAGRHRLTMRFVPLSYYLGLAVAFSTICLLAVTVFRPRRRRRRGFP